MRKSLNPAIPLERSLSEQIYNSLQGPVVEEVLKLAKASSGPNYWKNTLEGHSFKVDEKLLSRLYNLFYEVKGKLDFKDPVDFYITGDATVNAFAVSAQEEGEPHIINVNSALIQLMTDDELRFVIGHELGHLINKDANLLKLISFIFPPEAHAPIALQYKIRLWNQLSELVADRYGYMAIPDIGVCVSAFFKMSSGLDFGKMDMKIDAFIEENIKRLEYFMNDKGTSTASHPINPIRVQAINLFATCKSDKQLQEQMGQLIDILMKIRSTDIDYYAALFIATSGLIVASSDEDINDDEVEAILQNLSAYQMFPKIYLEKISKGNVGELFAEAVGKIMEDDPGQREGMFRYIISIVMADKEFKPKEVEIVYEIGQNVFGYTPKEISLHFAEMIQVGFVPSFQSLC